MIRRLLREMDPTRVIVIGGGITGLAAAHRLLELSTQRHAPLEVTLLEASGRLGGVIHTIQRDGFLIEAGPDNFITNKPWALELTQRLGLDDRLLETNQAHRRAMVVRRGRLVPLPAGFMLMGPARWWPVMNSPLFSWPGKLRIALEPFVPARRGDGDESLTSFVTRRFGRQMLDRLVQPLVGGIYTADPDSLSLRATMGQFLEMETRHGSVIRGLRRAGDQVTSDSGARYSLFVTFREGMQALVGALADRIGSQRVRANTLVKSVRIDVNRGKWIVMLRGGTTLEGDGLIIAVPSYQAASMLHDLDEQLASHLNTVEYASSAIVNLAYPRADVPHPLDAFGFVVPVIEKRTILAGSFSSVKYQGRAPDGHVLMRVFLGGALQGHVLELDDDALVRAARDDLRDLLGVTTRPSLAMVHRWPRSMPQYTVGHLDRLGGIRSLVERFKGLELAGNAYAGVGIPDCIHAGEEAAQRVLLQVNT